jgi:hypothetical protein
MLLPCAARASAKTSDAIEVSLDARASLFYDLECVTGGLSCSQEQVGALLTEIFGRELTDRIVADWAATLGPDAVQVQLKKPARPEWPDIGPDDSASLDLRASIQDVLFAGGSVERVHEKLAVIMDSADARALEAVFNTAWPAYSRWWSGQEGAWKEYAAQLTAILQSNAAPTILSAQRMFGRASNERMAVHLVPVPIADPINRAFQKGKRSFVQFRPDDDPAARVAVVVHGYCHFLFMTAPQDLHKLKMDVFARSAEHSAASAFSVMNEALASAIGNGLFMRSYLGPERFAVYASRTESFYAVPAVDRAVKAVLPLVERYARAGRPFSRTTPSIPASRLV